jgi:hypothetical protein
MLQTFITTLYPPTEDGAIAERHRNLELIVGMGFVPASIGDSLTWQHPDRQKSLSRIKLC